MLKVRKYNLFYRTAQIFLCYYREGESINRKLNKHGWESKALKQKKRRNPIGSTNRWKTSSKAKTLYYNYLHKTQLMSANGNQVAMPPVPDAGECQEKSTGSP